MFTAGSSHGDPRHANPLYHSAQHHSLQQPPALPPHAAPPPPPPPPTASLPPPSESSSASSILSTRHPPPPRPIEPQPARFPDRSAPPDAPPPHAPLAVSFAPPARDADHQHDPRQRLPALQTLFNPSASDGPIGRSYASHSASAASASSGERVQLPTRRDSIQPIRHADTFSSIPSVSPSSAQRRPSLISDQISASSRRRSGDMDFHRPMRDPRLVAENPFNPDPLEHPAPPQITGTVLPDYKDRRSDSLPMQTPLRPSSVVEKPQRRASTSHAAKPAQLPSRTFDYNSQRWVVKKEIDGEGLCWVFEDGTFCRTVIDGEPVNPSWGVTKAGKARKRLAQACLTCREKKIKCDPAFPKCAQCEKSGKECRKSQNQQAPNPPTSVRKKHGGLPDGPSSPDSTSSRTLAHPTGRGRLEDLERTSLPQMASEDLDAPRKRRRLESATDLSGTEDMLPASGHGASHVDANSLASPAASLREIKPSPVFRIENDPYVEAPQLTLRLLHLYFERINSASYSIFPELSFSRWVREKSPKSFEGRMVLYSVLALGSIFAKDFPHGDALADVATQAVHSRFGQPCLGLVICRVLLSSYNFSRGHNGRAWDFCGAALRAISSRKMNSETSDRVADEVGFAPFFNESQLHECRRRAFWSAYLMERYIGFCSGCGCGVPKEDAFSRLPCPNDAYDAGDIPQMPYLDNGVSSSNVASCSEIEDLPPLVYLIQISTIWADVFAEINRAPHRDPGSYMETYSNWYDQTTDRLQQWKARLPPHLKFSLRNAERSVDQCYSATFLSIHALFHIAMIKLNRHARFHLLPPETIRKRIRTANGYAQQYLSIMVDLSQFLPLQPDRSASVSPGTGTGSGSATGTGAPVTAPAPTKFNYYAPFPGYVFLTAIDVLSAGGLTGNLPALISSLQAAAPILNELSLFWHSARVQKRALDQRVHELARFAGGSPISNPAAAVATTTTSTGQLAPAASTGSGAPAASTGSTASAISAASAPPPPPPPPAPSAPSAAAPPSAAAVDKYWGLAASLDPYQRGTECDVIYGVDSRLYFEAFYGVEGQSEHLTADVNADSPS